MLGSFLNVDCLICRVSYIVLSAKVFEYSDDLRSRSGLLATRGSKFWSSKVCEGGESREAYACRLNFDPPQFLFEINDHVTKTHFWSAFKPIENLILIQFGLLKVNQNWVFEQFVVTWLINCSKTHFWSGSN